MDNSNFSRNKQNDHLGVNKIGKNIRKSPIHQSNFTNPKQQPQPQVYNISKNDFRNIVQQLTGSPSQEPPPMAPLVPPHNPPKSPSLRLQKIRPPPLSPIARPPIAAPVRGQVPFHSTNPSMNPAANSMFFNRSPQPSYSPLPPIDMTWSQPAESPISAYMRYLQNSIIDSGSKQSPPAPHPQALSSSGLLPTPPPPAFPSPRGNGPALLPSPTSQFLMSSPTSFLNLLSPRPSYPLLSPGFQYSPPFTPNFSFSPLPQSSGILGPVPQLPLSPGLLFPPSPTGFRPVLSPRWRE
ncbi:protein HAIKU1-like [Aristolochia californica]|uniref:protein HAIKU1-like n=1 Tax=Aristolochia californica TaxID=171875 RepID=UPI0035E0EBC4